MAPKEKAKELIDKYIILDINQFEHCWVCVNGAKNCVLILVDEILNAISEIFETYEERKYWEEVKQEVNLFKTEDYEIYKIQCRNF
jgi:hypothetical protein